MANANHSDRDDGPWYKQPWPWILMAGPFLAIVGCVITISLAFQHYGTENIDDGGVKKGLVVTKPAKSESNTSKEK